MLPLLAPVAPHPDCYRRLVANSKLCMLDDGLGEERLHYMHARHSRKMKTSFHFSSHLRL
jgi:hypothetical protein